MYKPWREAPDAHEMVEVQLACEDCGNIYQGERPKWWVMRREATDAPWLGCCDGCADARTAKQEAFEKRTATRLKGEDDIPKGEPDLSPAPMEDEPPEGLFNQPEEHDEYWK